MSPRRLLVTLWAGLAVIGSASGALAQNRPTVFLHGFGSAGSDWAATAERLRKTVSIDPRTPDLPWRSLYEQQARDLQNRSEFSALGSSTVAVGHSNGGIVAREWSKIHPLDGIVTIGSPHAGAPIMAHMLMWSAFSADAASVLDTVADAFSQVSDWVWVYYAAEESLKWLAKFRVWSILDLATTLGLTTSMPVVEEMVPQSAYLNALNGSSNLAREASAIPNRVGIGSVAHNFYFAGPARAIAPQIADEIAAGMYGAAFALLAQGDYIFLEAPPTDVIAFQQSLSLLNAGDYILSIDPIYCRMVSRMAMSECVPNDGIVPIDSQAFPNAPNILIGSNDDGPAHTQEKEMSDEALFAALTAYVHVPPRIGVGLPAPPPPPPAPAPTPSPDPPSFTPDPPPSPSDSSQSDGANTPADQHQPNTVTNGLLMPGQLLWPGDMIDSTNRTLHLAYQGDGNLVLYDAEWQPLWASGTNGTSAGVVGMQGDGNFVMYDADGQPLWASGDSFGHPGAYLAVQNDGNVVIYDIDGTPLWATGTFIS